MTKTLNQIIETLMEELSSFKINDDFPIDPDMLKDTVVGINGTLMREEYDRLGYLSEQFYKPYFCHQVECLGMSCTINGIVIERQFPIYRVTMEILQTGIGWSDVLYFGLSGMRKNFHRVSVGELATINDRTFTAKRPAYAKAGSDFWIVNLPTTGTRLLTSMVIYADPRKSPGWSDETSIFPTPSNYKLELLVKKDIYSSWGRTDLVDNAQRALQSQPAKTQENE